MLILMFSVLAGTWLVSLAKANPSNFYHFTEVHIISPWDSYTYNTSIIQLEVAGPSQTNLTIENCWYRVDDEQGIYVDWVNGETVKRELNLTDGPHSISVVLVYSFDRFAQACADVQFEIVTIPVVTVLSLDNMTYYSSDLMLNYTVNEPVSLVAYSLDGGKNVTVFGNTTLPRLSFGSHSIVVYAWDTKFDPNIKRNVGASETITFTVAEPEPFPATLVATASIVIVVVVVAVFLLVRKHKH